MTIDDFFKQMMFFSPTIERDLDEHIEEFGQRLDTVVIEDIFMPKVINLLEKNENEDLLRLIFNYFEEVSVDADDYLLNIFSITVLEILGNDRTLLAKAKQYMGPITRKYQREADWDLGRTVE